MPSFDVVSKVDFQEVDNALNQARKEILQRFDFKDTKTTIELVEESFVVDSTDDFKVKAAVEVLEGKLAKRSVPLGALEHGPVEPAAGGRARQRIKIKSGIEAELAKGIVKMLKGSKLKVQAAVQGDTVRVSGKKRDDLQQVIAQMREGRWSQPLQFENFRD